MKSNINLQEVMKELFSNSCLGYTYSYLGRSKQGAKPDMHTLTTDFLNGWNNGWITDNGYVTKPIEYLESVGIKIRDIKKVPITKLSELPEGVWVVEYKKTPDSKDSHFVAANKKKIIFDCCGESVTCKVGKPVSYREFII